MAIIWNTSPCPYPSIWIASERIAGFTTMMYDIARNVVSPATSSVRTSDPCDSTSNRAASVSESPIERVSTPGSSDKLC